MVKQFSATILSQWDGIWSRKWVLAVGSTQFTLAHHEDIGNYFVSEDGTPDGEALMRRIAAALNERLSEA